MLSTENPPPDPSEISKLKSCSSNIISSDEKGSSDNNQLEVDLFKSGLDDNHPLPKFSIRDYVFNTRGKDIETHWPFSPKNLQLCMKHGVKDVLPPFQTLESVRKPSSIAKCADENISNSAVKLSGSSDRLLSVSSNNDGQKLAEEDKEYPSTTTSLSKSPYVEAEAENFSGPSVEKPDFAVPADKVEISNTQNPVKKCRLIVKLGNIADPKSNEDLSETMASKVCPVCKTFTSSSNTTLNAHIDQCLSGESTIKCTTNSKVIKHRIKPRKTRLMVDIYETALCCTLEDLDRRNGTNWASNLGFPAQDLEVYAEEKNNNKYSSMNISKQNNDEGAVYFDSNGTKLRILSKFSDMQSNSNGKDDCGLKELVKRDKGSKIVSSKKKKYVVERQKLLKRSPYGQTRCSPRLDHCKEVNNVREIKLPPEENDKEDLAQPLRACNLMKSNDSGMIKQWVGSKRTESQHRNKTEKNLRIKSYLPLVDDKLVKRTCDLRFPIVSDEENASFSSDDEYMEQPCRTKGAGFSREWRDKKTRLMFSKGKYVKRLKEDGPSVHKHSMDPTNGTRNHAFSRSNNKMRSISPTVNVDSSFISSSPSKCRIFSSGGKEFKSRKKTSTGHAILSGDKKLSSLSKNLLPGRHAPVSESKKNLGRKRSDFKKPRLRYTSGSDEEAVGRSANCTQNNMIETRGSENAAQREKDSGNLFFDRARVLKIRKRRWDFVNTGKDGDTVSKHSDASSESDSHGVEQNIDSFVDDSIPAVTSHDDATKVFEIRDEFVRDPISKLSGGEEALIRFSESLDSGFRRTNSDVELVAEVNANEGEGNYFVDVDPIPIPGPPGSFLPSPGRTASEELQGNSSLTTCRIHSSEEDEHELIDMDSSDSPISGTSFISSSIAASGSDSVSRAELVIPETGPDGFKNRSPCRCSRKEGVSQSGSLNYQDSQLLRRRDTSSLSPLRTQEKQMDRDPDNNKLYGFDSRSDEKEPTPNDQPEKVVVNSQSSEAKFPIYGDCESPSISTSNPVLRLMGKNLMVVSKEENLNLSPQTRPTQSSMVNEFPNLQPFDRHNLSRGPSIFDNTAKHFDFTSSVGSNIHTNFTTRDLSSNLSTAVLSSKSSGEGFRSSSECREYAGGYIFTPEQHKEIIVIDDSPENEASLAFKTTYRENMESRALGYDTRHANPFYSYQTRCYPFYSGSQMVHNSNPSDGMNTNLVNWNRATEGRPSALHRNSLTASSAPTGHQRSPMFFSSGFSLPSNFT